MKNLCTNCDDGLFYELKAKEYELEDKQNLVELSYESAIELHNMCTSGDCDCKHESHG